MLTCHAGYLVASEGVVCVSKLVYYGKGDSHASMGACEWECRLIVFKTANQTC